METGPCSSSRTPRRRQSFCPAPRSDCRKPDVDSGGRRGPSSEGLGPCAHAVCAHRRAGSDGYEMARRPRDSRPAGCRAALITVARGAAPAGPAVVRLLLDTCTFLWLVENAQPLSPRARAACRDCSNDVYLSALSAWEIGIKYRSGRCPFRRRPTDSSPAAATDSGSSPCRSTSGTRHTTRCCPPTTATRSTAAWFRRPSSTG